MSNDLVSIIMHSRNAGRSLNDSVRSILAQTYQNWELLFVDNSSKDDSLSQMLKQKDLDSRIKVSYYLYEQDSPKIRQSAINNASGHWIAFIEGGDLWEPDKLEKQISFMEEHDYFFSYTKLRMIGKSYDERSVIMGGKNKVTYRDMLRCCWPSYPTVMYDAQKIGPISLMELKEENGYAIWLTISKRENCYLLDECLSSQMQCVKLFNPFPIGKKLSWRYQVYRSIEEKSIVISSLMTLRNLWNGLVKRVKYTERV